MILGTRADRIYEIIAKTSRRRLKVREIVEELAREEGFISDVGAELSGDVCARLSTVISATVRYDNKIRRDSGVDVRFKIFSDGDEERGFVSIKEQVKLETSKSKILNGYASQIPVLIQEANDIAKEKIRSAIKQMKWTEFESLFMLQVLEGLGFSYVEITQPTRDGGLDAICKYRRGLVQSEAIVSAKHWNAKVAADEVQRLRGIKGHTDTAIIFTSSKFSDGAVKEALPSQNQRSVVLIDGDLIVETCFKRNIGVQPISLPSLYEFSGFSLSMDQDAY